MQFLFFQTPIGYIFLLSSEKMRLQEVLAF